MTARSVSPAAVAIIASTTALAIPVLLVAVAAIPGLHALLWGLLVVIVLSEVLAVAGLAMAVLALVGATRRRTSTTVPIVAVVVALGVVGLLAAFIIWASVGAANP